jgi:hypothetical protein
VRPVWSLQQGLRRQGSCLETLGASLSLHTCSRRVKRRIESSDRYYPYTWIEASVLFDSGATHSFISIVFINTWIEASVLFDSGATHSFISIVFIRLSRLVVRTLEPGLAVTTPVGKTVVHKRVVCKCPVSICGRVLPLSCSPCV